SYMTDGLCGVNTPRACPGEAVPLYRGDGRKQVSVQVGVDGKLTYQDGAELPQPVPISTEEDGPFHGGLFGR
ncbi:MAG: hypothetical protein ACRDYV_19590, partial [Acidimicrobiia bacterium]